MARALSWTARRTGGDLDTRWVIEGVASYGAGLAATVAQAGYEVVEAARMNARATAEWESPLHWMLTVSLPPCFHWKPTSCAAHAWPKACGLHCGFSWLPAAT